jgi:transcriptional regulator GlxA family with amidase domain
VIGYCAARLREPIRMEEIALAAGYSQTHVSRLFAQHMGKTIAEHLRDLRMAYAQDLLVHSTLPVAEIGRTIGYTDQSNFGRAFKAAVGVPPRHYRHGERMVVPRGSEEGAEVLAD